MLEFKPVQEQSLTPERWVELLQEFRQVLVSDGMASIDEYGDMLKWGVPKKDGVGRAFHVFHPGFCSYSDRFFGTIHYHGGWVRGSVLAGGLEHITYRATEQGDGDRFLAGKAYRLEPTSRNHLEGSTYTLPAMVPHWVKPRELTITCFEEEDNERMGDLLNPESTEPDHQPWEQEDAEALVPALLAMVDAKLAELTAQLTA